MCIRAFVSYFVNVSVSSNRNSLDSRIQIVIDNPEGEGARERSARSRGNAPEREKKGSLRGCPSAEWDAYASLSPARLLTGFLLLCTINTEMPIY